MPAVLRRFEASRLVSQGARPLWVAASGAVAGLSGSMLTASQTIWAETGPGGQVAVAAGLFTAGAVLARFSPRPAPPRGLVDRAVLADVLEQLANGGQPAALILCEVAATQAALLAADSRLARLLPQDALAARWSEQRMLIAVPGEADPVSILDLARNLTAGAAAPGADAGPGTWAGIAMMPSDGLTLPELLAHAELALAEARRQGAPGYGFYAPHLAADASRSAALRRAVREAVSGGGLRLEFQPVHDMATGELRGFEALMRLDDPELGPLRPSEFIPLAEQEGHILAIGQWALEEACRLAAQWPDHLVVAVNLSPAEVLSGTIVGNIRRALQRHALPAYRLEVEITEGTLMSDSELVLGQLRMLRDMGVGVALDDFGTGYSSLSYLCKFPFSKLKIDRSFTLALDQSASAKNVLRAIVRLGHGLGMTITAEGIETERQLAQLRGIGCDLAQGYLLGKPAPVSELAAIILRNFADGLARRKRRPRRTAA